MANTTFTDLLGSLLGTGMSPTGTDRLKEALGAGGPATGSDFTSLLKSLGLDTSKLGDIFGSLGKPGDTPSSGKLGDYSAPENLAMCWAAPASWGISWAVYLAARGAKE